MASSPYRPRVDSILDPTPSPALPKITLSDLCDDVLLIICSYLEQEHEPLETPLKSMTLVNRRLSQLVVPLLFKSLRINAPLKLLRRSQAPLTHYHAHSLTIDMFGSLWWWCSGLYVDHRDARDVFEFVQSLPLLRTLEVRMLGRSTDLFEAAFASVTSAPAEAEARLFLLPQIRELTLTPSACFLVGHCPNLRRLAVRDAAECTVASYSDLCSRFLPTRPCLPAACLPSASLTHLHTTAIWSTADLVFLVASFPRLTHLTMACNSYTYRAPVPSIVVTLRRLEQLHSLRLLCIHKLDVGYQPVWKRRVQECSTKEQRMRLWRDDEAARVGAENSVVRSALRCCAALSELWLGEQRVARRVAVPDGALRWRWERLREGTDMLTASVPWAQYRRERESVVVGSEMGL